MFEQIHDIVFHGNGGYDWFTIYEMPIWLRNFTYNQISDYYKEKNTKASKNQNQNGNVQLDWANPDKSKIPSTPKISPPSYMTKMSKK
jgi:hypothetical protein